MFGSALAREIALILLFKLIAILLLFFLFFGPQHRPDVTPEQVHQSVFRIES
jgi:hypothetical protein